MTDCRQLVVLILHGIIFSMEDYPKSLAEMEDMT